MRTGRPRRSRAYGGGQNVARSLVDVAREQAVLRPGVPAFTYLSSGEREQARLTFGELDRAARSVAAELQRLGLPEERALLIYPAGLEFIVGFLGCLYAGVVAVPAYPPRSRQTLPRLRSILRDSGARAVLTTAGKLEQVRAAVTDLEELADLAWIATDAIGTERSEAWEPPALDDDSLAFLQYTSGSTGDPKGVAVRHGNLLHNEECIRRAFGQTEDSVVVGWLPLFHDMGLVGNVLQPLYVGARCILMSPLAFLARPARWLEAVSRYGATTSGGPSFSYDLCVRKVTSEERRNLDLSSWKVAFNGAEPVRYEALRRFEETFARCGFRRSAFFPCYGLAEATLFVTGGAPDRPPRVESFATGPLRAEGRAERSRPGDAARDLVSCGTAPPAHRVIIVDAGRRLRVEDGRVGEIWVAGPSVAAGYWGRSDLTRLSFGARLADDPQAGPFLRTGDLGFVDRGDLFVTGRSKDLLIVRGRNHHPHDIEESVERACRALRPGCGAAFAVDEGGRERVIVAWEVGRGFDGPTEPIFSAVRQAVLDEHGIYADEVALLRAGTIPKTSSGKIRRSACAEAYLRSKLDVVARSAPDRSASAFEPIQDERTSVREVLEGLEPAARHVVLTEWVRSEVARAAQIAVERVEAGRSLTDLGVDSLAAAELKRRLEDQLEVGLGFERLLSGASSGELATELLAALDDRAGTAIEAAALGGQRETRLSHGQEGLWFLQRMAPESSAYNLAIAVDVHGHLQLEALEPALEALVHRHPVLRSVFLDLDGAPVRRAGEAPGFVLRETDAASMTPAQLERAVEELAWSPFDLSRGPLVRVGVWRRGRSDAVLLLAAHHIVADLRTLGILFRDLEIFYRREIGSSAPGLSPPSCNYGDYVRWQRRLLFGPRAPRLWNFWLGELEAPLPVLDLPVDRPRPPVRRFRGMAVSIPLGSSVSERVTALARRRGATRFVVLAAAFQSLLHRYSGQDELLMGTVTAGRSRPEHADLAGYLVNPVALRAGFGGRPTFEEHVERVRRSVAAALDHADLPFPLLAERLQPERDPGRSPVFQALFVFQDLPPTAGRELVPFALGVPGSRLSFADLTLTSRELPERASLVDLSLRIAAVDGGLAASLQLDSDLFDTSTGRRLLDHFARLLASALDEPGRPVDQLDLLSAAERAQLLEWNLGPRRPAPDRTVHGMVAEQARRTPQAVAIRWHDANGDEAGRLTYGELVSRARRFAVELRALGVGPEVPVGVSLERSGALVVALLAVLEAGGAYVPLDPSYPPARLRWMLEDSGATVVIGSLPPGVGGGPGEPVTVVPGAVPGAPPAQGGEGAAARSENLAYVIYTSGSTGRPKGVALEHRNAVELLRWAAEVFSDDEAACVLAATSISFDLSVFELFATLSRGGCAVLVPDVSALPNLPDAVEVSLVNTVPSAMGVLVRGRLPSSLRTVNLAGEALPAELADELHARPGVRRVLNLYGPSEDTTYSTWTEMHRGARRVTVGKPATNRRARILDRRLDPVPIGVAAELCLGGAGLARGYFGRAAQTAERFVPDPFDSSGGGRLYRSGDLARYLPDGEIELLGRIDHQVKLRGFRIELGEVESALRGQTGVEAAAVVVREDLPAGPGLVAFVVAAGLVVASLHDRLARQLPEFMRPARIVPLAALPLTPSGKVDRRRLGEHALPDGEAAAGGAAPRTPTEEILAALIAEVVGRDRVSVEDDFFRLGGHSLAAMRLVSRMRQAFSVEVPVATVFQAPTVRGLATWLDGSRGGESRTVALPPITAGVPGAPAPASFEQRRVWFHTQLHPGEPSYNMPVAIEIGGPLNLSRLAAALQGVIERHEVLATRFSSRGSELVQIVHRSRPAPPAVADLSALPPAARGAEEERQDRIEARRPFDLRSSPPLRVTVLRSGRGGGRVLLTLHHIAADGLSLEILANEVSALYDAAGRRDAVALPELEVQYADYARWQRDHVAGAELDRLLGFWRQELEGAPESLELPSDRPRQAGLGRRSGLCRRTLSTDLTGRIEALARRRGVTPFMTLLTALGVLMARLAGEDDVVIGSPVAHRPRPEVENLIGMFVNTLPLRLDLSSDPSAEELVSRVREVTLRAYRWLHLPFERLVEELAVERSTDRTPIFQVMLAWQESLRPLPSPAGVDWRLSPRHAGVAKFDLSVRVTPGGGELRLEAEYPSALFDRTTIDRWLGHLEQLVAGLVDRPQERVGRIPLLSRSQRHQLLASWADAPASRPATGSLHRPFEECVARNPEAVAVRAAGRVFTYGRIERDAGRLARRLIVAGVEPGDRVLIRLPRSPELVVALLGVLKAGAAFVPLDPAEPPERTALILEDCAPRVLIGDAPDPPEESPVPCLAMTAGDVQREEDPVTLPSSAGTDVAYVIYTSGSSGRPKGVEVEHRSVSGYLRWIEDGLLGPRVRRLPWITRMAFDAALKQVFWPLSRGGAVEVVPDEVVTDARALLGAVRDGEVDGLNCVPSLWAALVLAMESDERLIPANLGCLFLGGEVLAPDLVARTRRLLPRVEIVNLYGPTEATANACWTIVGREEAPVIGRPLPGRRAAVVDSALELAPPGVPGELCLGGIGLARGYLRRPSRTARCFVPDPWSAEPGARLYRTGDRVRRRPDGVAVFEGRIDDQVKLRGFRVELGEIEAALRLHPAVGEAVVVVRDQDPGEERLVAYLTPRGADLPDAASLRDRLGRRLPSHMLPSRYVFLDRLPRTATGKIDRRNLPAPPGAPELSPDDRGALPRSPLEQVLTRMMAEVLGVEKVDVDDNFFELGGHSLLATELINRVQETFEVDLPMLHVLFDSPTVGALADYLTEDPGLGERVEAVASALLMERTP